MKADLRVLIDELMALRPGEQFALFFEPGSILGPWSVDFVNQSRDVSLGEVYGTYSGGGRTPEIAVAQCIANVKAGRINV